MLSWFTRSFQNIQCFTDASTDIIYHTGKVDSGSPDGAVGKNLPDSAGDTRDMGLIPGSERSPGGGNGTPLQYSCLENPMDRGAWWATVHGVIKSQTRLKQLSMRMYNLNFQVVQLVRELRLETMT